MKQIHVNVSDELHKDLKHECIELNIPVCKFVLNIVMKEVKKRRDLRLEKEKINN